MADPAKEAVVILVRDIFQLQFGKAKDALAEVQRWAEFARQEGYPVARVLTDMTGEFYTLVIETSFEGLGAFEEALAGTSRSQEWRESYARFTPLVASGRREVFRIVE